MPAVLDPVSFDELELSREINRRACYAPWARMDPCEFVERKLRIAADHGSTRPWSWDFFKPQKEMFQEMFNPRNREIVFKLASRLTKTWTVLAALGYWVSEQPRRIGVMWPKIGDGEDWSKKHLTDELLKPNPFLEAIIPDGTGRRKSRNTILNKFFPGGYMSIFGANVPGDLRRFKGNVLYADEIDAIDDAAQDSTDRSDEGDILKQFHIRGTEFQDTVEIYCSFPSLKGRSKIDKKHAAGDCRVWRVPCLKCGFDEWVMHRRDLRYDKSSPEGARLECPHCHALHDDSARYQMSRITDKWTPTSEFRGIASFHANAMLWPHPVDREKYAGGFLHMLALEEIAATEADNPERERRVIVNTRDAESYQPEHLGKIEHSALYKRREKYDPREMLPPEVVFVTCGIDLQADRAEIKFKGFGVRTKSTEVSASSPSENQTSSDPSSESREESSSETSEGRNLAIVDELDKAIASSLVKQSWAIDYRVVRGSPLRIELWERLESVLRNAAWPHPSGAYISPGLVLMDSSYRPDEVYQFARRMADMKFFACEGAEQLGKAIIQKKPIKRGNPPCFVWEIGTHEAKDIIYQQLEITDPAAQGYCHYPEIACFSEQYFRGLTIEESIMQRARDGNFYRFFFKKSSNDRNEALDTEVYANAAEQIARPNYEKLMSQFETSKEGAVPAVRTNPDQGMKVTRPKMNPAGKGWMSGYSKI